MARRTEMLQSYLTWCQEQGEMPQWDRPEVDMPGIREGISEQNNRNQVARRQHRSWFLGTVSRRGLKKFQQAVNSGKVLSPEQQRWAERTPPCPVLRLRTGLTNIAVISLKAACGVRTMPRTQPPAPVPAGLSQSRQSLPPGIAAGGLLRASLMARGFQASGWGFLVVIDYQPYCAQSLQSCPTQFSSVQFSHSRVWLFATPWTAAHQACLSITNSQSLLKLMSIESVMPSNHLILCRPLLLPSLIFPSIRVFSNVSVLRIR